VPPGALDRAHGRRELAEGAPHEILGSLRAARVRGALDQLPRLLHEPSDGGRDALPALMRRIRKLALGQVSTPGKPSVA